MHQLRSKRTVRHFRIAALLVCLVVLSSAASVVLLGLALYQIDWNLASYAAAAGVVALLSVGLRSFVGLHACCPLCMTPVLTDRRCSKHRHARTILGSHCLRVALSILFRNSFRCPYCHEPTAVKVRPRHADTYPPRRR